MILLLCAQMEYMINSVTNRFHNVFGMRGKKMHNNKIIKKNINLLAQYLQR